MRSRIYFFTRTVWDLIPAIWNATSYKNFDVGVFRCNDSESWSRYLELKENIAKIIDPTYKSPSTPQGHMKVDVDNYLKGKDGK